jgi:hypothetical protein
MTKAVCQLPYPAAAIPTFEIDAAGRKGGQFGNHSPLRKSLGLGPHQGVDWSKTLVLKLGLSTTFTSPVAGTVVTVIDGDVGTLGRRLEVVDIEGFYWTFCHAANFVQRFTIDEKITLGQAIAPMGSTGTVVSVGNEHLHLALSDRKGGYATGHTFDPVAHILARQGDLAGEDTTPLIETDDDAMKYLYSSGLNSNIGYAPGHVVRIEPNQWNQHQASLGLPVNVNAPLAIPDNYLPSFLFIEAGLPFGTNLAVGQFWSANTPPSAGAIAAAVDAQLDDEQAALLAAITSTPGGVAPNLQPILDALQQLDVFTRSALAAGFAAVNANLDDTPTPPTPGQIADEQDARERKRLGL